MRGIFLSLTLLLASLAVPSAAETLALEVDVVEVGRDPVLNQPFITITLRPESKPAMAEFSRLRVGEAVSLRLGDMMLSQPVIREPILQGTLTIGGNMTDEDAERIAREINAGTRKLFVDGSDR